MEDEPHLPPSTHLILTLVGIALVGLASCFSGSAPINAAAIELSEESLEAQVMELLKTTNPYLRDVVAKHLQPLCHVDEPHASGLGWIALSRILFTLTVPNVPIDPASIRNSNYHRLTKEKERLESQLSLHRHFERLLTGSNDNELLRHIHVQLHDIEEENFARTKGGLTRTVEPPADSAI